MDKVQILSANIQRIWGKIFKSSEVNTVLQLSLCLTKYSGIKTWHQALGSRRRWLVNFTLRPLLLTVPKRTTCGGTVKNQSFWESNPGHSGRNLITILLTKLHWLEKNMGNSILQAFEKWHLTAWICIHEYEIQLNVLHSMGTLLSLIPRGEFLIDTHKLP